MSTDPARVAAVRAALPLVSEGMTISLGSGRAVFALAEAIGQKWNGEVPIRAAAASSATAAVARKAGIPLIDVTADLVTDIAFDGADEVDGDLHLIKGGGAALLQEKLVMACAERVVIFAQVEKLTARVGTNWRLPVEVVRFAWETTRVRLEALSDEAEVRLDGAGNPLVTDEGHHIIDIRIPDGDLEQFARQVKLTLGVVEHGLFLDEADEVILGNPDGTSSKLTRA